MRQQIAKDIAALLVETGRAHHQAFEATDGEDADWAIWYARSLQEPLGELLGRSFTQTEIVLLLVEADKEHNANGAGQPWPQHYGKLWVDRLVPLEGEKLALYHMDGCRYCLLVKRAIEELEVDVEYRDIMENEAYRRELLEARGRATVPVLRCSDNGTDRWIPESRDIIRYLEERFA